MLEKAKIGRLRPIMTRQESRSLGLTRYNTGKPCLHGHYADRRVVDGRCIMCRRISTQKRKKVYRDKYLADKKRHYYHHKDTISSTRKQRRQKPEVKKNMSVYGHQYYLKNKDKIKKQVKVGRLQRNYGLTLEQYDLLKEKQKSKCAICGLEKPLVIDHCHKTNKVRALLCSHCNRSLGVYEKNQDEFQKYLEAHK